MIDHKDYSLKQVENFLYDAMSADATAQEIYDVIKSVVEDNYYTYKNSASQAYELLALLNGNGKGHLTCDKDDLSPECKKSWSSFWEEPNQYTNNEFKKMETEVRDLKAKLSRLENPNFLHYTEEEIDALMAEKGIAKLSK